ncbi:uncharacterized protein SCHCODRAFT_02673801 [Schizophyllum commune H4-8]|uniref:uncharacterized protein n=1 Tax=Schizophyllum commune (strain H4-8 / FGSC 9210) TaxID=578458 RepID=UPI00215EFFDE|nr:uncharacterized protein SCHCODRAFT_02673801 [Schizophyllum commune H4-8]KAI5885201.1 hypothetical protein SCHCODRAFT_02673801 [Schizophyllum commune H4-8]
MSAPTATSPCAERALSCPTTTSLPPFQPVRVPAPLTTYASLPFAPPPSLTLSSLYLPHSTLRAMTKRGWGATRRRVGAFEEEVGQGGGRRQAKRAHVLRRRRSVRVLKRRWVRVKEGGMEECKSRSSHDVGGTSHDIDSSSNDVGDNSHDVELNAEDDEYG